MRSYAANHIGRSQSIRPARSASPLVWKTSKLMAPVVRKNRIRSCLSAVILTLRSFAIDIHGEDRRVSGSPQCDDPSECNAVCFGAPSSERWGLEFPVRDTSADVMCCSELSTVSWLVGHGLR